MHSKVNQLMQDTLTKKIFDVDEVRKDFPILSREVGGNPLVYLDNAATSQKPQSVINAINDYYSYYNANIHRGVYYISIKASEAYENAKIKVKEFINASSEREVVFTRGATEAINLIAYSYGLENVNEGDEIIISEMEHHANIVPWQVLCEKKKAVLKVIPVNDSGELLLDEYKKLLSDKTKIVAVCQISNTLGTINPVKEIIRLAKDKNKEIAVVIDGAQAIHHTKVDVRDLGADFYVFSSHKMYGPMGIGVLYGRAELLEAMPPYQTGGDMISSVSFKGTTYNDIPMKFEAGTPNVEGAVGLAAAIDYIGDIGFEAIHRQETELLEYAAGLLEEIKGLKIIGTAKEKTGVISFIVDGLNALDIGIMLDTYGVAVRTGQHCTEPLMERFGIPGTVRVSFAFYNTKAEIDIFVNALKKAIKILS
ncbi:MAG TPA: cysteine desulfurase [Ignavibacteria bacterium]|nr:cysteine desulfurase [Ignavibacteria bacterium]HMQ98445.1 cysteine desulfurase [Ignavibacteria bacterium]